LIPLEAALRSIKLDKEIPIPLYYQLEQQVLKRINSGELKDGDLLPAESELCELLDISRPTVRQAFSALAAEGYLQRFKGRGTFVAKPKVEERFLSKLQPFNQEMLAKGMTPSTEVLALEKLTGRQEINEKLELPRTAAVIYLSRLRSADELPLVFVETYIPYEPYKKLMNVDYTHHSLYDSLESLYNVRVNRVYREIEAVNARRRESDLLNIAPNNAVNLVKTIAYAEQVSLPVEYSVARYRGDKNKFTLEIFR